MNTGIGELLEEVGWDPVLEDTQKTVLGAPDKAY
jgi:hypothetical protein